MNIKNEIQWQIDVNSGSEKRVISRTMERCPCSANDVRKCIDWLLKKGFIMVLSYNEMNQIEKNYSETDNCRIFKNIMPFDEVRFHEEEKRRKDQEKEMPNKDKFKLYFTRMEKEFTWNNIFNEKDYKLCYGANSVNISINDNGNEKSLIIDFDIITDLEYYESDNSIVFKSDNRYFIIELYYLWGKCCLKHYSKA